MAVCPVTVSGLKFEVIVCFGKSIVEIAKITGVGEKMPDNKMPYPCSSGILKIAFYAGI